MNVYQTNRLGIAIVSQSIYSNVSSRYGIVVMLDPPEWMYLRCLESLLQGIVPTTNRHSLRTLVTKLGVDQIELGINEVL